MLRSMTGFGRGAGDDGARSFVVEIRAVNHKYCDVRCRLPRELSALETPIQSAVKRRINRGRLDVSVEIDRLPDVVPAPVVDLNLAAGYQAAYEQVRQNLSLPGSVELSMIVTAPGVIRAPVATSDPEHTQTAVLAAVDDAIESLESMRAREGDALRKELTRLLHAVEELVTGIEADVPTLNEERRRRFEERITELVSSREQLDSVRLEQEIAILIDKADVSEELARLDSHFRQFKLLLSSDEPVGRKLDFLLQEMNREVNTIGSKCSNAHLAHTVVELKSGLEKIREQVQNVE